MNMIHYVVVELKNDHQSEKYISRKSKAEVDLVYVFYNPKYLDTVTVDPLILGSSLYYGTANSSKME